MTKKMYTNKPVVQIEDQEGQLAHPWEPDHKRIQQLEDKVRHLSEQVQKMATALSLNNRQIRKQNTDINNINTVVRNR